MAERGWKAVFKGEGGRFFSIFMGDLNERSEYIEGETTHRKEGFGPLTCFNTKEQARHLALRLFGRKHADTTKMFPCEFEESEDTTVWTPDKKEGYNKFPEGTRFADSITILKPEEHRNEIHT